MKAETENKPKQTYTIIPDVLLEKEDLSINAKVILGKILNLSRNCKEVKISNDRLSQLLGNACRRTVQYAKKELIEKKLISVSQEEKGRGNLATIQVHREKVNTYLGYEYFHQQKDDSLDSSTEKVTAPPRPRTEQEWREWEIQMNKQVIRW